MKCAIVRENTRWQLNIYVFWKENKRFTQNALRYFNIKRLIDLIGQENVSMKTAILWISHILSIFTKLISFNPFYFIFLYGYHKMIQIGECKYLKMSFLSGILFILLIKWFFLWSISIGKIISKRHIYHYVNNGINILQNSSMT